jgi:hypothetical protein
MNKLNICGYIVVSKPDISYLHPLNKLPTENYKVGNIYYGGLDRLSWGIIVNDYYDNKLPDNIRTIYSSILDQIEHFIGAREVCNNIENARCLLEYCNHTNKSNELIAVYSKYISTYIGSYEHDISYYTFNGIDLIAFPEFSLLASGFFSQPKLFTKWTKFINNNGLFKPHTPFNDYIAEYLDLASKDMVEPLGELEYTYDQVLIYSLNEQSSLVR